MREEELLNLIEKINAEKCVVILGPHLATENNTSIVTELNKTLVEQLDKVTYYEDEDVLGMAGKIRNNFIQPKINAFFDGYKPNEVYELLSEVPFSLVINTVPDKFLLKAMKEKGITPSYSYYHKGKPVEDYEHNFQIVKESDDKITTHIYNIFGDNCPHVSSTKSMTGHECWMAGASEVVYSMLMMQHSFVAPNINLKTPDEDAAKLNIVRHTLDKKIDVFLSNSFGFGGTNSALIIKKI